MGRRKLTYGLDPNVPLICVVCGDKARGNNFSVLTCVSCKSFFRRHCLLNLSKVHCRYSGTCQITKETRTKCLYCRLKKCFATGMDPLMIRSAHQCDEKSQTLQQMFANNQHDLLLPAPKPLKLLQNDSSNLTQNQWDLISNILHVYEEQNLINRVKNLLEQKSALPLKLRLKPSDTLDYLSQVYKKILPLLEYSPHLQSLSLHAKKIVRSYNVVLTASFNGYFIGYETDSFRNTTYMSACNVLFGSEFMDKYAIENARLLPNGILYKLFVFILIFSSNGSIILFDSNEKYDFETEYCSSIELFDVQNIYVTILWKYLMYLYGYDGSITYFNRMIKNILDMLARTEELLGNTTYKLLADKIAGQINDSIILKS